MAGPWLPVDIPPPTTLIAPLIACNAGPTLHTEIQSDARSHPRSPSHTIPRNLIKLRAWNHFQLSNKSVPPIPSIRDVFGPGLKNGTRMSSDLGIFNQTQPLRIPSGTQAYRRDDARAQRVDLAPTRPSHNGHERAEWACQCPKGNRL